jgi:hypothetical protein
LSATVIMHLFGCFTLIRTVTDGLARSRLRRRLFVLGPRQATLHAAWSSMIRRRTLSQHGTADKLTMCALTFELRRQHP